MNRNSPEISMKSLEQPARMGYDYTNAGDGTQAKPPPH